MSALRDPVRLRRDDAEARVLAVSSFDHPLFVEAGAGTGKTTALVARIVAWCMGPGWREAEGRAEPAHVAARVVAGVLAITFTEAAAADMEKKLRATLRAIAIGEGVRGVTEEPDVRRLVGVDSEDALLRAAQLLEALDRPVALTIHAWCRALLAEYPLEAGLSPLFHVDADGAECDDAVRAIVESAVARAYASPLDADWTTLARHAKGPTALERALRALVREGATVEDLRAGSFAPARVAEVTAELAASASALVACVGAAVERCARRAKRAKATLESTVRTVELVRRHACRNASDLQGLCDALPGAWENESVNQLSQWPNKGLGTTIENELGASAGAARDRARDFHHRLATFLTLEPELFVAAQRVLAPLLADVRNTLRAGGVATFADLLRDARDLLRANASVLAALRRRTRLLLVDEFQDTDPVQCDLVRSLALDTGVGAPSDAMPSLFVVGDPKQSIYAWRRADLAAYERFQSDLLAARGETARLSVNYRSTPAILAAVEQAIAPVMIASAGLQPAFETLVSSSRSAGAPVERWVSWELDEGAPQRLLATPPERATAIEARWIAADLTERRAAGAEWKDMAILLRTSGSLDVYLREMRVRDIPYDVVGDRSYYRRREIIEASALVRAIVDPLDHLALLATLRASVVGVPDAALIPLWTQGFPAAMSALASDDDGAVARVNESIARALPLVPRDAPGIERVAGWEHALLDAALKLGRLRRSLAEDPLDVFVERVRTLFLWEALEGARFLGAWRAANLERFFRRLAHGLSDDAGDPHAVLRALSRAVRDERDVDDARPKDEQPSAVQVMTIHKAKGLEFAHVYVASMHRGSRRDAIPDVDVAHVGGRTELVLLGAPSLGYVDVCARRVQQASAERVRTLYVAMTRAKDRLVMAGSWPNSKDRGSHALVWAASAPADAAVRLTAASSTEDRRVEIDGIAYRLPPPIGEPAGATTSGLANAVDARAAEIDSTRLAELRRAASARMSRPFAEAASIAPEIDDGARVPERARGADGAPVDRAVTRAVGTAIHRALEELDAREGRDADVRARRDGLRAILARLVSERELAPAISAAESIFDRFVAGALFARLRALAGHVIAREMPLVSIPLGDDGAVGYVGGAVDLLYRDPDTRELVVADYKTDAVRTRDEALARAPHHAAQAKAYRRAVREALELEREPRFELWFLQADAIVPLPS